MKKILLRKSLLIFAISAIAVFVLMSKPLHLGLDLKGALA